MGSKRMSLQPWSKLEVVRPEPQQWLRGWGSGVELDWKRDHNGLQTVGKPHELSARLWHSHPRSHETSHHKDNSLYSEKYTSVLIPPPHPTAFFLQPPVSSPSWALHHYGLFLALAHRSRWLNRCFMALRHLKLILCKTDLHFSLTNLQLLHFFLFSELALASLWGVVPDTSVFYTAQIYRIAQFCWVHTSNITPSTFILHIAGGNLLKQEFDIYHSKSLWTTSHFSWYNDPSP